MKTGVGHYYVFFSAKEFWEKVNFWKEEGLLWIEERDPSYNPIVKQEHMPCVLAVDTITMMYGRIDANREKYFSDPIFVQLYKQQFRKKKLERILKS